MHHAGRKIKGKLTQDDTLTRLGKKDAKIAATMFEKLNAKFGIKAIYTSSFFRCNKTAKIINKKLKVPIYEDQRLNEFKSVDNETWIECQKRTISAIKDIVSKYSENDAVICVTSGVNLAAFIAAAFKLEPQDSLPFPTVATCSPIGFEISKSNFE